MSAIAGILHFDQSPHPAPRLGRMLAVLSAYGPESSAEWSEGPCALGNRAMPFLPEDRFDTQPLASPDGRFHLVADVRLDNRDELAAKLGLRSGSLRSTADSTLLFAAWQRWKEGCLEHLVGDFAFAVWDRLEHRLFLARDHAGARPLYYHHRPGAWFAFASMPKGLHALPELPPVLDEDQVACYLALVQTDQGRMLFRDIQRLPHAHSLTVTESGVRLSRYWSPGQSEIRLGSDNEYLDAFLERFDAAVQSRLRGLSGIASHLSAGLDSGSVTATAARLLGTKGERLTAFTSVPLRGAAGAGPRRMGDEGAAAAEVVALHPNVDHVLVQAAESSFLDLLDPLIASGDQPPFNPTNTLWITAIQREAKARGLRVILTGSSGNATISQTGMGALADWFRRGAWLQLVRTGWALHRQQHASFRSLASQTIGPNLPFWLQRHVIDRRFSLAYSLVHPDVAARLNLEERAWDGFNQAGTDPRAGPRRLLGHSDHGALNLAAHATHGVDPRDPTRDKRVVDFCFGVPVEQLLRGGRPRSLIRRAMRGRLPDSTLTRTARGLQSADWHLSMGPIRDQMLAEVALLEQSPMARRLLDLSRARDLLARWPTEGFHTRDVNASWHMALSRGLSVGRFIRHFDPDTPKTLSAP